MHTGMTSSTDQTPVSGDDSEIRKYRAPALEKGLDVLELLAANGEPMTPSQMSSRLNRSVSELFRMIQVLEFRGYIEQSSTGYRLTNRLFALGMAQAPVRTLTEAALPVMRGLAEITVQSCHLVVPTEDQIVVIARMEAPSDLGYSVRIGYRRNLFEVTSGLLLFGLATPRAQETLRAVFVERYDRERVERFERDAGEAAGQGYARRPSRFVKGVTDLVAPIVGADGIIATLVTPYFERVPPSCDADAALEHLRKAAAAISENMGTVFEA